MKVGVLFLLSFFFAFRGLFAIQSAGTAIHPAIPLHCGSRIVHVRDDRVRGGWPLSTVIALSDQIAIFQCQVFLFRPNQS